MKAHKNIYSCRSTVFVFKLHRMSLILFFYFYQLYKFQIFDGHFLVFDIPYLPSIWAVGLDKFPLFLTPILLTNFRGRFHS